MDKKLVREFADSCNGVCHYLFFFLCIISRAIPNETEPIIPQISSVSTSADRQSSVDILSRSPGGTPRKRAVADVHRTSLLRLLSHPTDMDPGIQPVEVCKSQREEGLVCKLCGHWVYQVSALCMSSHVVVVVVVVLVVLVLVVVVVGDDVLWLMGCAGP